MDQLWDVPANGLAGLALCEAIEAKPLDQPLELSDCSQDYPPLQYLFPESASVPVFRVRCTVENEALGRVRRTAEETPLEAKRKEVLLSRRTSNHQIQ